MENRGRSASIGASWSNTTFVQHFLADEHPFTTGWWWLEHDFHFPIQLGISSSQLTYIFQRGWNHQPDLLCWIMLMFTGLYEVLLTFDPSPYHVLFDVCKLFHEKRHAASFSRSAGTSRIRPYKVTTPDQNGTAMCSWHPLVCWWPYCASMELSIQVVLWQYILF